MKKKIAILLLSCLLALSSCGKKTNQDDVSEPSVVQSESANSTESSTQPEENNSSSSSESIEPSEEINSDEDTSDIELTIPADFVGQQTQADLDKKAEEYGIKSIVLNSDGSATYTMTKQQHTEFLEEYRAQINSTLNELIGSEDYPNFTAIKANENYTEFTITTKSAELDMAESFSVIAFYMYGGIYNVLNGEEIDNISVTFINADSGEIISVSNSSDMEKTN
mgnify:FL=1